MTFEEFYPEYLAAHRDRRTKIVHAVGLLSGLAVGISALALRRPALALGGLALGYLPAFVSHWISAKRQTRMFQRLGLILFEDPMRNECRKIAERQPSEG